jgi:hypothetical protein
MTSADRQARLAELRDLLLACRHIAFALSSPTIDAALIDIIAEVDFLDAIVAHEPRDRR